MCYLFNLCYNSFTQYSSAIPVSATVWTTAQNRFICPLTPTTTTAALSPFTYDWVLKSGTGTTTVTDFNTLVCTGSTFTYSPAYAVTAPTGPFAHEIVYTPSLVYTWSTATKK